MHEQKSGGTRGGKMHCWLIKVGIKSIMATKCIRHEGKTRPIFQWSGEQKVKSLMSRLVCEFTCTLCTLCFAPVSILRFHSRVQQKCRVGEGLLQRTARSGLLQHEKQSKIWPQGNEQKHLVATTPSFTGKKLHPWSQQGSFCSWILI